MIDYLWIFSRYDCGFGLFKIMEDEMLIILWVVVKSFFFSFFFFVEKRLELVVAAIWAWFCFGSGLDARVGLQSCSYLGRG